MVVVSVESLNFAYRPGAPVIQDLSLEVQAGERMGIVGPNGAGKTTLLLLIAGLLKGEGRVFLWGEPQPRRFKALRKRIGFLFQDPDDQLFMPTVLEEVLLETGDGRVAEARRALKAVGLLEKAEEPVSTLSPGEKKRLALATLWVRRPDLWLLDEPSAGLDPGMRRDLILRIRELPGTVLVATHDLDLAWEVCDRVVLLWRGRAVAVGPTREVLANGPLLREYGLDLPLRLQGKEGSDG